MKTRKYELINEEAALQNWSCVLKERFQETNPKRIAWMSLVAENKCRLEGLDATQMVNEDGYGNLAPAAYGGMGTPLFPDIAQTDAGISAAGYKPGSGDTPTVKLGIAMFVARYAFALDLLPVIPMERRTLMYSFLETIYGNGKTDNASNPPVVFRVSGGNIGKSTFAWTEPVYGSWVYLIGADASSAAQNGLAVKAKFLKKARFEGDYILKFEGIVTLAGIGTTVTSTAATTSTIKDFLAANPKNIIATAAAELITNAEITAGTAVGGAIVVGTVDTQDEQITSFTNRDGITEGAMERGTAELGTTNNISLKLFTKSCAARTRNILAGLTTEQLKDLASEGIDASAQIYKAAQNVLVQAINEDVVNTMFRLGVTAHAKLKASQGLDLNLFIGPGGTSTKDLANFVGIKEFKDILGNVRSAEFTGVKNSETNSSAENLFTRQQRLAHRILGGANVIGLNGRYGRGDFAVLNYALASALQASKDCGFNPIENTIQQNTANLYTIGDIAGIKIMCDPAMAWNDTRILIGYTGTEDTPGLKFGAYDLASSIETIAETSMAPKIKVSSSYALIQAGMRPEAQYLTLAVDSTAFGNLI